jgi:hypothetical protein
MLSQPTRLLPPQRHTRWGLTQRSQTVTDLLATIQELEHLGVGFVSPIEALDLTTPATRAMAALLAVFAAFEREILGERVRAGLAHARQTGKRLADPQPQYNTPIKSANYVAPASANPRSPAGSISVAHLCTAPLPLRNRPVLTITHRCRKLTQSCARSKACHSGVKVVPNFNSLSTSPKGFQVRDLQGF